jgi:phenylpyruvate tautomerase PptA (4-oxalocrotonate tautomerase family)/quinol monooxygenase YgiN
MPIVEVKMFNGRDDTVKGFIARAICDAVGEIGGVSRDGVHVVFDDVDRGDWAVGPRMAARRTGQPANSDPEAYVMVGRITVQPGKNEEYLSWRRHSVFPFMESHDGFLGSTLLSTPDDPNTYVIINKWRDAEAQQSYLANPREAELRVEARQFVLDLVSESFHGNVVDVWSAPKG